MNLIEQYKNEFPQYFKYGVTTKISLNFYLAQRKIKLAISCEYKDNGAYVEDKMHCVIHFAANKCYINFGHIPYAQAKCMIGAVKNIFLQKIKNGPHSSSQYTQDDACINENILNYEMKDNSTLPHQFEVELFEEERDIVRDMFGYC